MAPAVPSPDKITQEEFTTLLDEYPSLVDAISKSKGSKTGQKTLRQLDEYRYGTALSQFGDAKHPQDMTLEDVKLLVEWKLRHGKFRPSLMGLASSNPAAAAQTTISSAVKAYRASSPAASSSSPSDASIATALAALTKLRGIGPATASLLLTVHDPARVIFFSDEAFYWLCCGGKAGASIKYNNKEYEQLRQAANKLVKRLGVGATDVEKVAYVLFKRDAAGAGADDQAKGKVKAEKQAKAEKATKAEKSVKAIKQSPVAERRDKVEKAAATKRKSIGGFTEQDVKPGMRRSKRVKKEN